VRLAEGALTLILTAWNLKNENKSWMVEAKYFFKKQKCLAKNLNKLFCFRGFHLKCTNFQYAFDDNLSVTHIFIKQIFRAV
jgi:hypothetical protein